MSDAKLREALEDALREVEYWHMQPTRHNGVAHYGSLIVQIRRALDVDPEQDAKDAARYRWLRAQSPGAVCAIAWRVKAACAFGTPDEATDAAMAACPGEELA